MASKVLKIDPSSSQVSFSVKKIGILDVKGTLTDFNGQINFDNTDLENSSFDVCVNAATIDTGNSKRDEHLKSKDFFFVENHPDICFQSTAIQKKNGKYLAVGNLTILNTTKAISIPFSFNEGVSSGAFTLNRLDYDLGSKFPAFIVGKTIQISIHCKIKLPNERLENSF